MRNAGISKEALSLRRWLPALYVAVAGVLAGCGNLNSIHRSLNTSGGTGALIDAKQRAIIVSQRTVETVVETPEGPATAAATGEAGKNAAQAGAENQEAPIAKAAEGVGAKGVRTQIKTATHHVVCAEPSPDAMSAYAAEFAAELSKTSASGSNYAAGVNSALQEAAAFIGMRTPSIQLLRDAMYRVCEAYGNGAITSGQYELLMRRYQRHMVALTAIEQLTQAGRVPVVTISSQGSVGGDKPLSEWTDEIKRHRTQLDKDKAAHDKATGESEAAQTLINEANAALEANPKDTKAQENLTKAKAAQEKADTAVAAAKKAVKDTEQTIADLKEFMPGGTALSGRSAAEVAAGSAADNARNLSKVAPYVERIAMKVLDTDDTGALCFEHAKSGVAQATLDTLCTAYLTKLAAYHDMQANQVNECTRQHKDDAAGLAACLEKVPKLPSPGVVIQGEQGQKH